MNIKKTVNVKFNSNFKLNGTANTTVNNNNADYYIDWSAVLKNDGQHYSVIWTYVSQPQVNAINNVTPIASVYTNIYGENYIASSIGANVTLNIGSLITSNSNSLYGDTNTNAPIFMYGRPNNNNVNIQIRTNENPPAFWQDQNAAVNGSYILTLSFTEL